MTVAASPPLGVAEEAAVRTRQVEILYSSPALTFVNLVNAVIVAALIRHVYPLWMLLAWIGLFLVIVPARLLLRQRFLGRSPGGGDVSRWAIAFAIGSTATGCAWGLLATVVFVTADPSYYVFAAFVLGGMTAGAALQMAAYIPAYYGFAAPAVVPLTLALFFKHGPMFDVMGLLLAAFSAVLALVGRANNRWLTETIRLTFRQEVLNRSLKRRTEEMTELADLTDILQACNARAEAYPIIAQAGKTLFDGARGGLSVVVEDNRGLHAVAQWGEAESVAPAFAFEDCWALRTGHQYEVMGLSPTPPCRHYARPPPHGHVCRPLSARGEILGLLQLELCGEPETDDARRRLMVSFGDAIKLSLSNLKLRETLSEQALRDQLTGLFNRRYLVETLPREIHRAEREDTPLTLAVLDLDGFKQLNDEHGHEGGDLVLRELGRFLKSSLRAGDIACRYGGEEFVMVLANCDAADAQARLRQIGRDFAQRIFVRGADTITGVTMSAGVAQLCPGAASAETLIAAADEALYAAKEHGRDRVELYEPQSRGEARGEAPAPREPLALPGRSR